MYDYASIFAADMSDLREPAIAPQFQILVRGEPVKQRYYRLPPDDAKLIYQEV